METKTSESPRNHRSARLPVVEFQKLGAGEHAGAACPLPRAARAEPRHQTVSGESGLRRTASMAPMLSPRGLTEARQTSRALFFLDACQWAGQLPLDVDTIGCDVLAGTGRKFLRGPRGTGFLWVCRDRMDEVAPAFPDVGGAEWQPDGGYALHRDIGGASARSPCRRGTTSSIAAESPTTAGKPRDLAKRPSDPETTQRPGSTEPRPRPTASPAAPHAA
jgi:Aminotransferase class-V